MKVSHWVFFLTFLFSINLSSTLSLAAVVNGKVTLVQGEFIELDVGSEKGMNVGDSGRVYYVVTVVGVKRPVYIAKFKITNVSEKSSVARIEDKEGEVKTGQLIEVVIKERKKEPKPGEIWRDIVTGMEFIYVKGGCFEMGDNFGDGYDDEQPPHEVCVDGFWMGKYEVTQGQWKRVMGDNPSYFEKGDDYPVESVSWEKVRDFIASLNQKSGKSYRLPTEAEWEYAARSGGKREKWAGTNNEMELEIFGWYSINSNWEPHPVGEKRPNSLGLYDMSGNVYELVQDWYQKNYYKTSPRINPEGAKTGTLHVLRGGGWNDGPRSLRVSNRNYDSSSKSGNIIFGFRLVLPAK